MSDSNNLLEIHFLIFSGKPNPKLEVTDELAHDVSQKFKRAEKHEFKGKKPHPKLGYQGFLVINTKKDPGLPASFSVVNGLIMGGNGRKEKLWTDTDGIEKLLLDEVRKSEHAKFLEILNIN